MVEYSYDVLNQLTQYKGKDGAVTTYGYDGTGMRTAKTMNGETTRFYWDRGLISNESVNGTITATNYIGVQGIFARQQSGATDYLLKNGHMDVTAKINGGAVTKTYDYDAFGVEKNPDAGDTNPFRYCGEYFDNESGSIYLRARYYMPGRGRFTQEDPARDGFNWYAFCANDPINRIDITGLSSRKWVRYGFWNLLSTFKVPVPVWEPNVWNDIPKIYDDSGNLISMGFGQIQESTNCYAYALNLTFNPSTMQPFPNILYGGSEYGMPVGTIYMDKLEIGEISARSVIATVKQDLAGLGWTFEEATLATEIPESKWLIAIAVDPGKDYHFYRRDADGNWSHKLGWNEATRIDASGNIITNPKTADMDYSGYGGANYQFVGFYLIGPNA